MDIQALIKSLGLEISEESAKIIAEAFDTAVNEKSDAKVALQVESALKAQDEVHAKKLGVVLEAVDKDHTSKMQKLVSAINENHAKKLRNVIVSNRRLLTEQAAKFSKKVVQEVSNYLDLYVEQALPTVQLAEAVNNKAAHNTLAQIRKMLSVDAALVNESTKTVIAGQQKKIREVQEQLNESHKTVLELTESNRRSEVALILEQKTKGMPADKRTYVTKLLSDKDVDHVKENFEFVVEMFEQSENSNREAAKKTAKNDAVALSVQAPKLITESKIAKGPETNSPVSGYLTEMKRTERKGSASASTATKQ